MITTTDAYKTAVISPSRKTKGRVVFEIVDTTAKADITTLSVTSEAPFSKKVQTYNNIRDLSGKYITLEKDYWILDDSMYLMPKSTESGYEIGWWSSEISGADTIFSTPQELLFTFTGNHSSIGITVTFDKTSNEYATDFTITTLTSLDAVINTINVTGNTSNKYIWNVASNNYRKVKITINKTSNPIRRARISEIDFGIIEEYEGNELINMSVIEELSTTSQEVTTNEMKFTLDNQDKSFNILNPTGLYNYLQRKQQITSFIGVEIATDVYEYVPLGVYYLSEWTSDEGTLTASFVSRDVLDILSEKIYRKSIYADITLGTLATNILTDAGITSYNIDTALNSITVKGYLKNMTHREALQMVAVAGKCAIYSNRIGVLQIKQLSTVASGNTIDFDNMYNSPKIQLDKLINTIEVNNYSYTNLTSQKVYEGAVVLTGTSDVWIDYSKPATGVTATLSAGVLNNATYYTNSARLNITYTGTTTITAIGTELSLSNSVYQLKDGTAPVGEKDYTLKVDNTLINSTTVATNTATYILAESKKRNLYDINWRQDPSLEAIDIVTVEDEFGLNYSSRITEQQFDFNGTLSGKTKTKGASV